MPGLLSLNDDEHRSWLKDYGFTCLERDLGDLARLDDLHPFRKFQELTALRSGRLLNYSDPIFWTPIILSCRIVGDGQETVRDWAQYLGRVPDQEATDRLIKATKIGRPCVKE